MIREAGFTTMVLFGYLHLTFVSFNISFNNPENGHVVSIMVNDIGKYRVEDQQNQLDIRCKNIQYTSIDQL